MPGFLKRNSKSSSYGMCLALALASAALPPLLCGESIPPYSWSKRFGDVSADTPAGIAVDGSSNVFLLAISRGLRTLAVADSLARETLTSFC